MKFVSGFIRIFNSESLGGFMACCVIALAFAVFIAYATHYAVTKSGLE